MFKNRNSYINVSLILFVALLSVILNFTFGTLEDDINRCKTDMRKYCNSGEEIPDAAQCSREAYLHYNKNNDDIPEHIHEYFTKTVRLGSLIGTIAEPEEFCQKKIYQEIKHELNDNDPIEDPDDKCLGELADFIAPVNAHRYMIETAFMRTDVNSLLGKPFATLYLHYIARSVIAFSVKDFLQPYPWCEYFMKHGTHP